MSKTNGDFSWKDSVSLRDYIESEIKSIKELIQANDVRYSQRYDSADKAVNAALAAADRAVAKAENAAEKRFESVNEFRSTLSDQQRTLMPRTETELLIKSLDEKIDSVNIQTVNKQGQNTGWKEGYGFTIGIGAMVIAIITLILRFIKM